MPNRIQIIKHELFRSNAAVEVCFADGRESKFFYWDNSTGPTAAAGDLQREQELGQAKVGAEREARVACARRQPSFFNADRRCRRRGTLGPVTGLTKSSRSLLWSCEGAPACGDFSGSENNLAYGAI